MSNYICLLVTVLYKANMTLLKCAIKFERDKHGLDYEYLMETENRKELHNMLPLHVASCGEIVDIEELFEISVL